ncbi:MAG: hypothetical protein MJZ64_02265 [Paludibacteraceae bacterium]|nr:hypothetical protein [Paludibacteraceae bacterium]
MNTKIIYRILLGIACLFLVYVCINSVVTPIRFEEKRASREVAVIKSLVDLRAAEAEYKLVNGRFQADLDSLVLFLKTTPKKEVMKEGSLTDKQLEAGLTELKATKILERALAKAQVKLGTDDKDALYAYIWENDKEIKDNSLSGFRRDTIYKDMIETLYKGAYTAENIDQIVYIPFTDQVRFETEVNNDYTTSQGIKVPLLEIRAHYNTYLADLDNQERVNLIDKETKLEHYAGLKIGDITAPNNNAGNWE